VKRNKCCDTIERSQLKQELERLRAFTEGMDEIIYVSDPESYQILFANKKTKEIFGEEILGKKCYKVFQKLDHPCPFCTNKRLFRKESSRIHIRELQNCRNKHWYKCMDKAIKWPKDKYVRFGIVIDVTEQKKMEKALRESEELFRSIVENSHNCILIIDDNFKIIYANDEATGLGGYSKEEIVGQDFRKFLDKDSTAFVQDMYVNRQRGQSVSPRYEFRVVCKDGRKRDVEIKSAIIQDRRGKTRTVSQLLDITEHKRIEEERKRFEERLSTLNTYGQSLNMAKSMQEIYKLTLDAMEKTLGFEYASMLMVEGKMLRLVTSRGYSKNLAIKVPIDGKKGITARVAKTCQPIFVPDISEDKGYIQGGENIRSELAVPIKVGDDVLGVLNVESKEISAFNEEDTELLEILASHTAIAMSNLKRQEKLSALNTYGWSLNRAENMEEIYTLTLNAMEKTLGFQFVDIFLVEGKKLRLAVTRGLSKESAFNLPLDGKKGVTVRAARTRSPVLVPDVTKEIAYMDAGVKGMLSELAVPIKLGNTVLGVLNVECDSIAAFDEEDTELLEILASDAAIAISSLRRQKQLRKLFKRLEYLMKSSAEIMHIKGMHQRLKVIAKAIQNFGWRRVVISLRDENLEGTDRVTVGLTRSEIKLLVERTQPGHVWKERLGSKFERFKIGEFYYLPWTDRWIREYVHGVSPGASPDDVTTYTGVPSRRSTEEMVDWHPQDMLYAPLCTPEGRIVGILSMDDPVDGRKPTTESLIFLELFLHQAAITIENAQLIGRLREAREQLEAYAGLLEQKVEERTRELKKSQEQLLKAQRLAVIGEIAGMVGHDLRNPLTSIAGAEYYLKKRLSSEVDDKIKDMLKLIKKNIVYSNKIINDLLDYSKEVDLELTRITSKSIVNEALSHVEIPKNIKLIDLTESRPKISLDFEKIKRVFVNIIKNAVEAMPNGGKLTIRSRKHAGNLEISFSDTGTGMSKATLENLWTPLFTTKAKGMGFGLPICKRFVEAHRGSIRVESIKGKGTTFTVTFPIKPKSEGGERVWVKPLESSLLTTTRT
jgi:PAS domain S-box-containing protein